MLTTSPGLHQAAATYQFTSFSQFVFHRSNRLYLYTAAVVLTISWLVFKSFYPHPNIIFDSYYYIIGAVNHARVGPWPIGYSWFLRLVHVCSSSAYAVLVVQYLIINLALLYFFFTLRYWFGFHKITSIVLFLFLLLNPIFLFMSNLILSDILFTTLSLLWFTQLIWLIFRPAPYMLFTHALLLLAVFTVRYNALYYPVVGTLAFLLSRQKKGIVIAGIALQLVVLGSFIAYTTHAMQKDYGVASFSPFGSWKMASNALYIYENVYRNDSSAVPPRFQALDNRVRAYFNGPHYKVDVLTNDATWGSFYMWMQPSPLIQHMFSIYGKDRMNLNFVKFAPISPLYGDYGTYIIKKHPGAFLRYFIVPNIMRYMNPPQEVLVDAYNPFSLQRDTIGGPAIRWYQLTTLRVHHSLINFRTQLFIIYPALSTFVHYFFVLSCICFYCLKSFRRLSPALFYSLLAVTVLWLADFAFNITASSPVLRYQLFIMTIEIAFALVFTQYILESTAAKETGASSVK
ncbi:hypothetical protein HNQ91_002055 [Filimonas zeae]|uniref:Dolichyl-phosphate-mannose-protein mannosyltransferase n=1 Tax=Filimonas zeae TaxID=1737353 RepID=A0A917MV25_9BACT|nr:hypothetical protein [Filimonas zeae]MDR6339004.1 hypothetical protein [Filimonas zeae]GGH65562.1 hypothetical protein GCM10011379_18830 [Filimonas zeae]